MLISWHNYLADLVEQDERFLDYVIVHELLHLRFTTHGRVFKVLMDAHIPGWRELEVTKKVRNKSNINQHVG